jgi:hypothetical protein
LRRLNEFKDGSGYFSVRYPLGWTGRHTDASFWTAEGRVRHRSGGIQGEHVLHPATVDRKYLWRRERSALQFF